MTAAAANALLARPQPKRNHLGQYVIQGKPYTRVTTWAETVGDRFNLEKWQQRMVALGLVARQDLYAAIAATQPDNKAEIGKLCDKAIEAAKGSAGANLGTALHTFTERVDRGEEFVIPSPWDADVAAYRATLAAAKAEVDAAHIERIIVNHTLGVAGTFDRLLSLPGLGLTVGDVKTGGFLDWGAIAIQLALYANAEELYDPATDSCEPMPFVNLERAVVIHIPVGQASCTLYEVDITAGWEMAQVVGVVRRWRKRKDLAQPLVAVEAEKTETTIAIEPEPADMEMRAWLRRRAEQLATVEGGLEALAAAWPAGVPTFRQSENHTAEQLRRIEAAMRAVEQRFDLRVPNFDPTTRPDQAAIDAMISRLSALPGDLLAAVEAGAAGKIPNLRSAAVRAEHLETLEQLVSPAEVEHAARQRIVRDLMAVELDMDDPRMVTAFCEEAGAALDRLDAAMVERVRETCGQLNAGHLVFVAVGDGWAVATAKVAS